MKRFHILVSILVPLLLVVSAYADEQKSSPTAGSQPSAPAVEKAPSTAAVHSAANEPSPGSDDSLPPSNTIEGNDPLLQPPPLPAGKPTLVGGLVGKIDRVKNIVAVKPFGGGKMNIFFDDRTHIYRDGVETTQLGIHQGDRIYVDTLLDKGHLFAQNIRVEVHEHAADVRGQLLAFNRAAGRIELRDNLTSQAVTLNVDAKTVIRRDDQPASIADLRPGTLLDVRFAPTSAGKGMARQITIYAIPGSRFVFAGKVTYIDMSRGVLALQNQTDNHNYEIHFHPDDGAYRRVAVGTGVTLRAEFDGAHYDAQSLTVNETQAE